MKNITVEKDKLSFFKKLAVGVGGTADNMMQNTINTMACPVLNICLGVNPVLISVAIFIARLWDAFTDPVMGSISDNTRTSIGRRRPYVFLGGFLGAIVFVLLWRFPAGASEMGYFWWFLIGSVTFYTCYTIYIIPFNALCYELTSDYNERTRIMMFKTIFGGAAGIVMAWMYKITQWDYFENTLDGMQALSWVIAAILIVSTAIPAIFLREKDVGEMINQKKTNLLVSMKESFRIREFRLILGALVMICFGLFMVIPLGPYINIYYVCGGDQNIAAGLVGLNATVYSGSSLLAAPVVSFISSRIGKKRTLLGGLGIAWVGVASPFFTYTPHFPYLQLISVFLMAPGLACLWVLAPSMMADICDLDELKTNSRREGMFSAIYGYVMKMGVSLGILFTGFLLNASGFKIALGAAQSNNTILILRACYVIIPSVALLFAILLLTRYPLTAEKLNEIHRQIKERKLAQCNNADIT